MNEFEKELRTLFADHKIFDNPTFVGRACFGDIGKDLRIRVEFTAPRTVDHYTSLRATVLNRTDGVIDRMELRFEDILGIKSVPGNPNFPHGVKPYIWQNNGKAEWYAFTPTKEDYEKIRHSKGEYVNVFRSREERREKPSLDSILQSASTCAPGASTPYKSTERNH